MKSEKWLSILLPVYNVEDYLGACIDSIVTQTAGDPGIEIIMVEDASTDSSRVVAENLCQQYPDQMRLVYQSHNQGLSAARNRLLDEARGEHIWFIDSDDHLLDGAIAELRTVLSRHDPDLVLCDYRKDRLIRKKSFYGPTARLSDDIAQLLTGVFRSRKMYSWLKIARRSLWGEDLRFPVGKAFEDIATTPWLLLRTRTYYYVPRAWLHYRQRAGSIMHSVRRQPDCFDEAKHRDMAQALSGFKELLAARLHGHLGEAGYYLSDFCAKEFIKTGSRMERAARSASGEKATAKRLRYYRDAWQSCAPIAFDTLTIEYAKRLRFDRLAGLRRYLRLAEAS